jgi:alpha-D-ribose 1-methylphosphonate 5-triphosphate synthase subunit PhnH
MIAHKQSNGNAGSVRPGFMNAVFDSQATFRSVMTAMAEPGTLQTLSAVLTEGPSLSPALTATALTLLDFEASVWIDHDPTGERLRYLQFHTGVQHADTSQSATFAIIAKPLELPPLKAFAKGTLEYPDRATTLLVDVRDISTTRGWKLTGPGIRGSRRLLVEQLRSSLSTELAINHKSFPLGVDFIFCADSRLAALPRSTRVVTADEER